jgi:hypothetical protein
VAQTPAGRMLRPGPEASLGFAPLAPLPASSASLGGSAAGLDTYACTHEAALHFADAATGASSSVKWHLGVHSGTPIFLNSGCKIMYKVLHTVVDVLVVILGKRRMQQLEEP